MRDDDEAWQALLDRQDGLVSRAQCLAHGLTDSAVRARLRGERWAPAYDGVPAGVYATRTGRLDQRQRVWAALLAVSEPVAASHQTALWLGGARAVAPDQVHVAVPDGRSVTAPPGVAVHHLPRLVAVTHPLLTPPRVRVEASVLDVVHALPRSVRALDAAFEALQRRTTTAAALLATVEQRPRLRHRAALVALLADAVEGAESALEREHLRMSTAHGLPPGRRQRRAAGPVGSRYLDVLYLAAELGLLQDVVAELDGRRGHDLDAERFRDARRDNLDEERGAGHLRYGHTDVFLDGCGVAGQTAVVLVRAGWRGEVKHCRPGCPMPGRVAAARARAA